MFSQPSQGSANPSASFPALWNYVEPALNHILRSSHNGGSKAPSIAVDYYSAIHTATYNFLSAQGDAAVSNHSQRLNNGRDGAEKERFLASGCDLYEQLDRFFAEVAREILANAPQDDANLLHYYVPSYQRFQSGVLSIARLLNYINRHYVKRAVDEDRGWMRLGDIVDVVAASAASARDASDMTIRQKIAEKFRERRAEELRKWGYTDGAESLAQAEARAEAASSPDRIIPVSSLGMRRWRTDFLEPLLATPPALKGKGKRRGAAPDAPHKKNALPKSRLARAVRDITADTADPGTLNERRQLALVVYDSLADVGVRIDHPLRKKLAKFIGTPSADAPSVG
ncbi:hypothetical protein EXIGLDRAFT_467223 [Exidia glandulosa HHB12029]|uniref:Cullin repeat-containing protein n=1 Tax=Exidia glandulosa HHB12029 TaxID=1314781 RepID=A0A165K070_EXIGL|nr:hypothetical protein EXIGLDRAFT_467223 [Exidia glandulosa HHB12029]